MRALIAAATGLALAFALVFALTALGGGDATEAVADDGARTSIAEGGRTSTTAREGGRDAT